MSKSFEGSQIGSRDVTKITGFSLIEVLMALLLLSIGLSCASVILLHGIALQHAILEKEKAAFLTFQSREQRFLQGTERANENPL